MTPLYTLADLTDYEKQVYAMIKEDKMQELEKVKLRCLDCDVKAYLLKELENCRNTIRDTNEALDLKDALSRIKNAGTPPEVYQPGKWDYVFSLEAIEVYEAELKKIEQQQPPTTQKLKRARSNNFTECICDRSKTEVIMKELHEKLDGSDSGKHTAITLFAAASAGLITKPTFTQIKNEFNLQMSRQNYNQEYKKCEDKARAETEIDPLKSHFLDLFCLL